MKKKFAAVFCSALALTSTLCFGGTALGGSAAEDRVLPAEG